MWFHKIQDPSPLLSHNVTLRWFPLPPFMCDVIYGCPLIEINLKFPPLRLVGKVTHPKDEKDRNEAERFDPHDARLECDFKFQFLCM